MVSGGSTRKIEILPFVDLGQSRDPDVGRETLKKKKQTQKQGPDTQR